MIKITELIRPCILNLKPYSSARDEFKGKEGIFLDANENPYGDYNRYPDPYQSKLKLALAVNKGIKEENIFIGNGSDEVIDLLFRVYCEPGKDKVLTFSPTYGMYDVSAAINNVEVIDIPLNDAFQLDMTSIKNQLNIDDVKMMFICSPNNPTGNLINSKDIEFMLKSFNGVVVIDEAYIDFNNQKSWLNVVNDYPNLIVTQTLSKAWGLAGARIGMAYANPTIIQVLNNIKPPYNVSQLNQEQALNCVEDVSRFQSNLNLILKEKEQLIAELKALKLVTKVYPSDSNFILVKVTDANTVYKSLADRQIVIRNRDKQIKNCVRISIGKPQENRKLIEALKILDK